MKPSQNIPNYHHIWMNVCGIIHAWLRHSNDCRHSHVLENRKTQKGGWRELEGATWHARGFHCSPLPTIINILGWNLVERRKKMTIMLFGLLNGLDSPKCMLEDSRVSKLKFSSWSYIQFLQYEFGWRRRWKSYICMHAYIHTYI